MDGEWAVTKAEALKLIGGLSRVTALPCPSFSISAFDCQTGSKLNAVAGSVCEGCYARRGYYHWPTVKEAHARRLRLLRAAIASGGDEWAHAFAVCLKGVGWFRWHDSGDLQSVGHFDLIVRVCEETPATRHWLPTKEPRYVDRWIERNGPLPSNLTVRVSAPMVDEVIESRHPIATVHRVKPRWKAWICPVPTDRKDCGECRACWDRTVGVVSYPET